MIHPGATHRGAPFVGRQRELGLLQRLLEEGLAGSWRLIRVAGEPGVGRRRLLAEALRQGPDAEWVRLAPADASTDLHAWAGVELLDLLETYPDAPYPSWALHALARWEPSLALRAPFPAVSREGIPFGLDPEVLGSAVGALLGALTGRTLVVVDAGVWPRAGSSEERAVTAMTQVLARPGAITLAASGPEESEPDPNGVRTLRLGPLSFRSVHDLVTAWDPAQVGENLALWLYRISGGHPLFMHEVVRWLEELGHVQVEDEAKTVFFLHGVDALPIPLGLRAVMASRYRRLPEPARQILDLLAHHERGIERDALRRMFGEDPTTFEEGLTLLRRRDFLLHRSSRRPLAASTTLWNGLGAEAGHPLPRAKRRRRRPEPPLPEAPGRTPLAQAMASLRAARKVLLDEGGDPRRHLAQVAKLQRGRHGPAWDGIRGRLAVWAAAMRWRQESPRLARQWAQWGTRRLSPEIHPGLRRSLGAFLVRGLARENRPARADAERERLLKEAVGAGHFLAAAHLRAAWAEGRRRRGGWEEAAREAATAAAQLSAMGLVHAATMAAHTHLCALIDARRLDAAVRDLARERRLADYDGQELSGRLEALRKFPPLPIPAQTLPRALPVGWGWGVDDESDRDPGAAAVERAVAAFQDEDPSDFPGNLAELDPETGPTDYADVLEMRFWTELRAGEREAADRGLRQAVALYRRLAAGERARFLADAVRLSPGMGLPAFTELLRPLLFEPAPPTGEPTPVKLILFGRPRVEYPDLEWPMAVWPAWWRRLMAALVSADLLGEEMSLNQVQALLAESPDAPALPVESVLREAGQLLRGVHAIGGGPEAAHGRVVMSWPGIACDARAFFRAPAGQGWRHVSGAYLPGVEGAACQRVRARVTERLAAELAALAARPETLDAEARVALREGPGRVVPLSAFGASAPGPESP